MTFLLRERVSITANSRNTKEAKSRQGSGSEAFQMQPSRAEQFISHQDLCSKPSCSYSLLRKGWQVFLYLELGGREKMATVNLGYKACVLTGEPEPREI